MAAAKNTVMLKPDSRKMLIAMAEAELQPKELAVKSGVPVNIVYIATATPNALEIFPK